MGGLVNLVFFYAIEHVKWFFFRRPGDPVEVAEMLESWERALVPALGGLAALALILACIGIYGVMAYLVAGQNHEFGVRAALGAGPGDIFGLVLGRAIKLTATGVGIGIAAAFLVTRLMRSLLFGVSPFDPLTFGGMALLLTLVALVACYFPARRATRIDPMVALRFE